MTGNEIVLSLACALAEERARHEQTRQSLIRDLTAAHAAHDATRAAAQADREKLEREHTRELEEIADAARCEDATLGGVREVIERITG